jgi:electron transfer flavoprotein beta subunit
MNLAVCLKRVPDTAAKIKIAADGKGIDPQGVEFAISPYDELAIEVALRLKEKAGKGEVTAVSVDPDGSDVILRKALAIGADKGLLAKGGPTLDGWPVAQMLAAMLKGRPFDLLLFGKQAVDDDGYQVPTMVAHLLGLPRVTVCSSLEIDGGKAKARRQIEGGEELVELALPCVVSVQKGVNGIHDKRYPSLMGIKASKTKPVETVPAPEAAPSLELVKLAPPPERPPGRIVGQGAAAVPELVRLLKEEAKVL